MGFHCSCKSINFFFSFRVCYTADRSNTHCSLRDEQFETIHRQTDSDQSPTFIFQSYNIQTPIEIIDGDEVYPNNQTCSYSLEDRQPGYQYTYVYTSTPNIEAQIKGDIKSCYDCMEYKHTNEYGSTSELVTCGNNVDDRLNDGAGTISNIAITFKSDRTNGFRGEDFHVYEYLITGDSGHNGHYGKRETTNYANDQVHTLHSYIISTLLLLIGHCVKA